MGKSIEQGFTISSLALASATLFASSILSVPVVSADESRVDDVSIIVPISCNLNGTNTTHSATVNPGTTVPESASSNDGIGKTTLKVFCNDNNGFAIYAIGYTGNVDGTTTLVGNNTNQTIATGTNTTGNSSWSMKLIKETDTSQAYQPSNLTIISPYTNYSVVPSSWTKVANFSSKTDQTLGSVLYTTYRVYISPAQAADTYVGQVKYTLVHPQNEVPPHPVACAQNKICYNANTGTAVGTMGQQTASANTEIDLLASNFSRSGYGFVGWSPDYNITSSSTIYGPNETITTPADMSAGLPLYAVWVESQGDLQGWSGCSSLTKADTATNILTQSITALTDQRDNQTYAVAKLADGNCWMIENLRLESTNSDNSTGALAQGYGTSSTYGNFSGLAAAESTNFSNSTTANSLYYSGAGNQGSLGATIDIGTTNNPGYRMPRYDNINTQSRATNPTSNDANIYSYGNYYTWHAAIADLTFNGTNNQSTTSSSLCPAGWHLPTGGQAYASGSTTGVNVTGNPATFREFYNLGYGIMGSVAYDSVAQSNACYNNTTTNANGDTATKAFRKYPNNFLYSGHFNTASAGNRGSGGRYWSATASGNNFARYLTLNASDVSPGTYSNYKYYGHSIRCVAGS